jgi:hypothetical protein
MESGKMER